MRPVAEARAEYNATYRSRYLDEVAPQSIAGRLIKFKDGTYTTPDDGKTIAETNEFVLLGEETMIGWIKFNGTGEAPERNMGLLFDGWVMPPREELGDMDPGKWSSALMGSQAIRGSINNSSSCRTLRRRSSLRLVPQARRGGARSANC